MSEQNNDTPCIGVCTMEEGYCLGCGRSEEEIFGEPVPVPQPQPPRGPAAPLPANVQAEIPGGSD